MSSILTEFDDKYSALQLKFDIKCTETDELNLKFLKMGDIQKEQEKRLEKMVHANWELEKKHKEKEKEFVADK